MLYGFYGIYYALTEGVAKALVADIVPQEQRGTAYGYFQCRYWVCCFTRLIDRRHLMAVNRSFCPVRVSDQSWLYWQDSPGYLGQINNTTPVGKCLPVLCLTR